MLVNDAHVDYIDAARLEKLLLAGIDGANAEEMHVGGGYRHAISAEEQAVQFRFAAESRDRHAVKVA